jgi:hypothetical protein
MVVAGLMRRLSMEVAVRTLIAPVTLVLVLGLAQQGSTQIVQPAGAPLVYQGGLYYPSGPTVFFDGAMMVRVGTFEGLPIYLDPSRDPVNVVLVPIGGKLMRPYERTQAAIDADLAVPEPATMPDAPSPPEFPDPAISYWTSDPPAPRHESIVIGPCGTASQCSGTSGRGPASQGIWIEFDGRRWTPSAPGIERGPRHKLVGYYFDFPVYQEGSRRDRIFVPATDGGPLIQYDLRRP